MLPKNVSLSGKDLERIQKRFTDGFKVHKTRNSVYSDYLYYIKTPFRNGVGDDMVLLVSYENGKYIINDDSTTINENSLLGMYDMKDEFQRVIKYYHVGLADTDILYVKADEKGLAEAEARLLQAMSMINALCYFRLNGESLVKIRSKKK